MSGPSSQSATVDATYALLADLPTRIESCATEPLSQPITPERIRHTTVVQLFGSRAREHRVSMDHTTSVRQTGLNPRHPYDSTAGGMSWR
jgi:hypothetical protein